MNILAGDIGGTKTLLGLYKFADDKLKLIHKRHYYSKDSNSFDPIIDDFLCNLPKGTIYPEKCCIGVAGPVREGKAKLTNLQWEVYESNIKSIRHKESKLN